MIRRLKRLTLAFWLRVKLYLFVPLARVIGRFRPRRRIVFAWNNERIALGPKIVLFMHFDRRGSVRPQLFDYMRELQANGRTVVFVSNAERLAPPARAALETICACILVRRNIGYDFGAWRDALEYLRLPRPETEEVICANDSVFGPLAPLGDMLRRLDYRAADVWALTESWQLRYHLQSFFLAFGPAALRSPAFGQFWDGVRPVPAKTHIVRAYEVGVTQAMLKGGLRCDALWRYDTLLRLVNREEFERLGGADDSEFGKNDPIQRARKGQTLRIRKRIAERVALNPTADLWRQLLLSGFPFIKRELLRDNPTQVEDVGDWVEVVRDELGADPEPILLDLRTMLRGSAP